VNDSADLFLAQIHGTLENYAPVLSHAPNSFTRRPASYRYFNILELLDKAALQATAQNYSFDVIPIARRNRRHGIAKLKIREMGSRHLFIVLYLWLEKYFSRGDYRRQ